MPASTRRDEHRTAVAHDHEDLARLSISMWLDGTGTAGRPPWACEPAPERRIGYAGSFEPLCLLEGVDGLLCIRVEDAPGRRRHVASSRSRCEQDRDERTLVAVAHGRRAEGDGNPFPDVAVTLCRQHIDGNGERPGRRRSQLDPGAPRERAAIGIRAVPDDAHTHGACLRGSQPRDERQRRSHHSRPDELCA